MRLPKGVFSPYTSINTNILFFDKGATTKDVWFFEHPYPDGYKSYSRSKPLTIQEFEREKEWWGGAERKGRKVSKYAWKVSAQEIAARNYNLDCKNPHEVELNHGNPDELMQEYLNISQQMKDAQNALKQELIQALQQTKGNKNTDATIALLEKHFDIAFTALDGIKKLRELILSLAMQGKLVPQDPSEQPASELLKEIEAEKKRLAKEGKIKQSKPLPKIKPDETPYDLPNGWEWVRIRNICHDWGQKTPDKLFTYIDVGSIDNKRGVISDDVQLVESIDAPSRARKIVRNGTVIYSTVRPYLLNIAIVDKDFPYEPIASTAFAILHPFCEISNCFIYYYLRSPVLISYVESTMKGVAYPAINDGDFFQALFPLPPLAEQRRIVAKIDQLMALCNNLEKQIDAANSKQTSLLNAVMTKI